MAPASAWTRRLDDPIPSRTPPIVRLPARTMIMLAPADAMRSSIDCFAPAPSATIAMTAATPITTPSIVNTVRVTLRPSAFSDRRTATVRAISRFYRSRPIATDSLRVNVIRGHPWRYNPSMPLTAKAEAIVQPVSVAERMEVLDVLRGIAIYGILLVNISALSGSEFLTPAQHSALPLSRADSVLGFLLEWLVAQKFYSLFSFLFGVGFAVFVSRASARGSEPARLFKRRLAGLAIIGLVHTTLIWMGDILLTYALIGFALIPFLHRDDRTVLRWATMWLIAPIPLYLVVFGLAWFLPAPPPTGSLPPVLVGAVDAFAHGRYLDVVRGNLIFSVANAIRRLVLMFFPRVFGMFLLGFYAGRRNVFGSVAQHRPLFQRVLIW